MNIFLISGALAVGKSSIAAELVKVHGFQRIRSGAYLQALAQETGADQSRNGLQNLGDRLDTETDYRWLIDNVATPAILNNREVKFWLLDSVRKARQVEHFKEKFGTAVRHIHFNASDQVCRVRYNERLKAGGEYLGNTPYDEAIRHPNEVASRNLIILADNVFEVVEKTPNEIGREVMEKLTGVNNAPGSTH